MTSLSTEIMPRIEALSFARSSTPPAAGLSARQSDRVRDAVRAERKEGLLLAFRLRAAVLILVMVYLLGFGLGWDQVINVVNLAALCFTGWAQYRLAGGSYDRPLVMALFPVSDVLLVAIAVFAPIELEGFPRVIMDEDRPFSWFVLLLTMQALAYRPWLAVWCGFVTAAFWVATMFWLASYPGAHLWINLDVQPTGNLIQRSMAAFYDPYFIHSQVWVREALIAVLSGAILAVAVHRSHGMVSRAVRAERSRANLSRYFSPSMVDKLAATDRPFEDAREQRIGIVFADIVGFTALAENASPDDLIRLLREFHSRVAHAVFEHAGTLDKFIGDCVMATFGTPEPGTDDATRTIACASAIASAVEAWNLVRERNGLPAVRVGVGAHYGPVVTGDIGDERRLEFAVLGDTVNVASRLEHLTRTLGCTILVSDDLAEAARAESAQGGFALQNFTPMPPQHLRNREAPVPVWGWKGPTGQPAGATTGADGIRA